MKKRFIKPFDNFILLILGLISTLTGCNLINPPIAEYGVPHADYEIKGTVIDSITTNPIKNTRIIITKTQSYAEKDSSITHIDTLATKLTDSEGKYDIQFQDFPLEENAYHMKVDDIDGTGNGGEFISQEKEVLINHADLAGGKGGWYSGKVVKIIDIKLQAKTK